MINEKTTTRLSKFLSLVLRHAPETIGLELDDSGWASTDELLSKMNSKGQEINMEVLVHIVDSNKKKRFAFTADKTMIRANQGHSLNVELNFEPVTPPEVLYHGTGEKSVASILQTGIEKRARIHVHLSADETTSVKVGQRHGKPVILKVEALKMHTEGFPFYLSENNVWLTDFVPKEYILSK